MSEPDKLSRPQGPDGPTNLSSPKGPAEQINLFSPEGPDEPTNLSSLMNLPICLALKALMNQWRMKVMCVNSWSF